MHIYGHHANDKVMRAYVEFICSQISTNTGAAVNRSDGFPMKGAYVPVQLEILHKDLRTATINLTAFGHSKEFMFMLSRRKSPAHLLNELQIKVDEVVLDIIRENNLDQDKIWKEHQPFLMHRKLPK